MKVDLSKFTMSQSKLKHLEREDGCPRFWFERYVVKSVKSEPTDAQAKGLYFESQCLGAHAHDDNLIDPPTTLFKNNKWTAEGARMQKQIERFNGWFDDKSPTFQGHGIAEVQYKLKGTIGGLYWEGIADFITEKESQTFYMWDLKHTADVSNTVGDYGWGNYENLDYLQQTVYNELWNQQEARELDGMYMLVMDSSLKFGHKRIPVYTGSQESLEDLHERIDIFKETIEYYNIHGWPRITNKRECAICPVEDCPFKYKENLGFNDVEGIYL